MSLVAMEAPVGWSPVAPGWSWNRPGRDHRGAQTPIMRAGRMGPAPAGAAALARDSSGTGLGRIAPATFVI